MRVDVPEFKKCCCCIPLRYGILTWVYIRLVLNLLNLFVVLFLAVNIFLPMYAMVFIIFGMVWVLTDIGFSITFLVGAHKKNYKLLRVFYYFLLVCIGLYNLLYILIIGNEVYNLQRRKNYTPEDDPGVRGYQTKFWKHIIEYIANYILTIVATGYLVLLVRSEILKLMRNCKFEFVNNAAAEEAQCRLDMQSEVAA